MPATDPEAQAATPASQEPAGLAAAPGSLDAWASALAPGLPGATARPAAAGLDQALARLEGLQQRGAEQRDPVRWRFLTALARRTQARTGREQALLVERLQVLLADFGRRQVAGLEPPAKPAGTPAPALPAGASSPATPGDPSPLAALLQRLASADAAAPAPHRGPAAARSALDTLPTPDAGLRIARQFAPEWARLRIERQLSRARHSVPAQAGPLNAQRLVLDTLQALQQLSPDYLQHWLAHLDTLRWLEQADEALPAAAGRAAAQPGARKASASAGRTAAAPGGRTAATSGGHTPAPQPALPAAVQAAAGAAPRASPKADLVPRRRRPPQGR